MAWYRRCAGYEDGEALMPAIETTDWMALKAHIDKLVLQPAIPIIEPGAIIQLPAEPHILISDVTNDPDRAGNIDPKLHIRSGTLMLTLHWPISLAVSHTQMKEIAGQIAAHFPADTCMTYGPSRLRVIQDASALQPYVEGAYRVAVVRVLWSSM